ncbi:hypothetical protein OS493_014713 [Desmophyllum pertusum]|uniref:Citrate transport protein n=1 Tax=Desmophyllum pertusum TaxID=174260 RepID=A0A9X0CFC9_9CNID|nr:hypothetical protein OS493_014713 [Desmophyllum pertusum]
MVDDRYKYLTQEQILLCGLGAGVTEAVVIVCPMETVKVKFIHDQTQPKPRFKGFFSGVSTIVKTEDFTKERCLALLECALDVAFGFTIYENVMKLLDYAWETN